MQMRSWRQVRWFVGPVLAAIVLATDGGVAFSQQERSFITPPDDETPVGETPPAELPPLPSDPPPNQGLPTGGVAGTSPSGTYYNSRSQPRRGFWSRLFSLRGRRFTRYEKDPQFLLPPLGDSVNAFWATQISNGQAARMVLYRYDFVRDEKELTPRGRRQLAKLLGLLLSTPHVVTIQRSAENPELDELRRTHILTLLNKSGYHISPDRVVVQIPLARGLDGLDAEVLHNNLLGISGAGVGENGSAQ